MGGAISMTVALEYPDRVAALVLVGTGARLRVSPDILEITANDGQLQAAADLVVRWAFSPSASPRLIELGRERYGSAQLGTMHHDFVACDHFDVMDRLGEIECSALIICGEDDQLTPAKFSQFLADHIPQASLEIVPEAGHMVMLEKPEEISQSIGMFMEKTRN
jgi:pimeloyl-ACP methyl ester carboxylesterase